MGNGENRRGTSTRYSLPKSYLYIDIVHNKELHVYLHCEEKFCPGHSWKSSVVLCCCFCSMLLDKKFKSELVRLNAEAAAKLGTRSNRYETLLRQRHVQVHMEISCLGKIVSVQEKNYEN